MDKSNFLVIQTSFYEPIKEFTDEELGKLLRALFIHNIEGVEPSESDKVNGAFKFFRASNISSQDIAEAILGNKPKRKTEKEEQPQEVKEAIELIYKAYPTKCPTNKRSTHKSRNDKNKIEALLKVHTQEDLLGKINWYLNDCKQNNVYLRDFKTFLFNLPDTESQKIETENEKILIWYIPSLNSERKGAKAEYEHDVARFGKNNIEFKGYAR